MISLSRTLWVAALCVFALSGAGVLESHAGADGSAYPNAGGAPATGEDEREARDNVWEHAAKIALGNNANAVLSLDLIADGGAGNRTNDGVTAGTVSGRGTTIAIEVFATGVSTSLRGIILRFDFDDDLVRFVKAENSAFALSVPEGSVGVNLASTSPVTLASSGFLARAEFETVADVTGREFSIGVERVTLAESVTSSDVLTTTSVIRFNATPSADFDGDGTVGFSDLLMFAGSFGTGEGDSRFEARFDLNGDGSVGFADLLIFAGVFGTAVEPPTGGGGGGTTVTIADDSLRVVIENSLGKARNAPITRAEMATLTRLDATNRGIRNLSGLEHATNLRSLDLGDVVVDGYYTNSNDISNLSPLSGLNNLTYLRLRWNSISDISALAGLTNLTTLNLYANNISDISALSSLTNLTYLSLDLNNISDISALSGLTNLTYLSLFGGGDIRISDISVLAGLINLTTLSLGANGISDISALSGLTNLTWLSLYHNNISDISPLVSNTGLGEGDEVNLTSNPLSSTSRNTHVPALQRRGVSVEFDSGTGGGGGSDDHSNTRSDATILAVGDSLSGRIETGSDVDYFGVQVSGSGTLTVHTTGSLDTQGELQNSSGSALTSDDDGGNGRNFRIERPVSAGTYYVKVESYGSETGSYTIHARFSSGGGDGGGTTPAPGASKLYWTDSGTDKIQRSNLDGSGVEDLVTTGLDWPGGIAVDVSGGKIYWTDSGTDKIQRSNLDGSSVEDLVTTGLNNPEGIAVDVSGGKIYWTDVGKIQRSNLDGSGVEDLVTGLPHKRGIALDVSGGKIYWAATGTGTIQRSNLDGSSVEDLVTTGLDRPTGIAVDVPGGKIYWTSWAANTIQRSNLDGSGVEDLVTTGLLSPDGIAVDASGGKIYWAVTNRRKIQRSNLDGSGVEDLVTTGLRAPRGIGLGLPPVESGPVEDGPDVVVTTSVDDNTLTTGQSFTLSATVRNRGNASAAATTLRYYRSANATISTDDVEVGTDAVGSLSAGGTSAESISLNAPSDAGTYYYGACVDGVSGESNTGNNCSSGVSVTVSGSGGGNDKAVTTSLTSCTSTQSGFIYNVVIAGTVHASRSVSNVLIRGYAGTSFVGIASIGSMSAGQSRSFTITGIVSSRPSTCRIETTWLQGGNTSQGVVEHHSIVVDERERR